MRYVISYDISDDGIRKRISDLLEGVGVRVQKSVFECQVEEKALESLVQRLAGELEVRTNGDIRIYPRCERCAAGSVGLGELEEGHDAVAHVL